MSEKNNIFDNDLLMRAILEGGQEEVPGRVWEAVSESLDKVTINRRRVASLWWRRAGISVAVAAAAVASVLILRHPDQNRIVPPATQSDMIAVVEPVSVVTEHEDPTPSAQNVVTDNKNIEQLIAHVPQAQVKAEDITSIQEEKQTEVQVNNTKQITVSDTQQEKEYFPTVWEGEVKPRKIRTSLTLSGVTGATQVQNGTHNGMLKAPEVTLPPTETGIKEKVGKSNYGLPISFGAGIKIDFTPKWSLGLGINYTYLTRRFDGTYTHINEAGSIDELITSEIRNNQHYIGIPVNAYFNIISNNIVNFYAYAGGAVERCVYDKYQILSKAITHKETAKGVQLSANFGLGLEFMLGKYVGIYLDPSLRYYFDCKQPRSIRTDQPIMFGMEMGLRFRL